MQLAARGARTELHAIVPTVVAASEAVLRPDERERGVIVIDIGGMTTEAALFVDGALFDFHAFKAGGLHITRDLAMVLDVDQEVAEALKRRYGVGTLTRGRDLGIDWGPRGLAMIQNQARAGNLSRDVPRAIAGARFQQIMHEVREWVDGVAGGLHFYAGVVITGGASQMAGVTELARDVFDMNARCGTALEGSGFPAVTDPGAAASLGLVKYCALRASQPPATARSYVRTPAVAGAQPASADAFMGYANAAEQRPGRPWGRIVRNWIWGFVPSRSDA
jgi:cell division protein FtsA